MAVDELQGACKMDRPLVDEISAVPLDPTTRRAFVRIRALFVHLVAVDIEEVPQRRPTWIYYDR